MTISSLKAVLTPDFITKSAKVGSASSSNQEIAQSITGNGKSAGLDTTLRSGARNFALGVQALNVGITYLQVSKSAQEKLLSLADDLRDVIDQATQGGRPSVALIQAFEAISKKFDASVNQAKIEGKSVLDVDELSTHLKDAGLDPGKTNELAQVFKKMATIGHENSSEVDKRKSGEIPPEELLRSALSRAKVALESENPEDQPSRSSFFSDLKSDLLDLKTKISSNIKSLDDGLEFVGKNLNLVRATGFAFLDASEQINGSEQAESVAANIRDAVRKQARNDVGQAKYLPNILKAGVLLAQEKATK